jgi:hypothetical protein
MDLERLLALLEIDTPADLMYFEQFAELVESDEDIPPDTLQALFLDVDHEALATICEGYFDELLRSVPENAVELYALMQTIRSYMLGIINSEEGESFAELFTDEFLKFKTWYRDDTRVICRNNADGSESEQTLMEALTNSLLQGMTDDDYSFDFSEALDYEIDEYIVPVAKLKSDYDGYDEYDDYDDDDDDYGGDSYEGRGGFSTRDSEYDDDDGFGGSGFGSFDDEDDFADDEDDDFADDEDDDY